MSDIKEPIATTNERKPTTIQNQDLRENNKNKSKQSITRIYCLFAQKHAQSKFKMTFPIRSV